MTNALGPEDPRRSPRPAATTSATADISGLLRGGGGQALGRRLQQVVEVGLRVVLALLQRVHQLGGEDLLGAGEHLLLAGREALVVLADGEVADDLGELVDVTGLDLVAVVLEPAVPVLGHLGQLVLQHGEDLLHGLLVDDAPEAGDAGVLARDHDGHVVVQDLDGEVLALLTEHLLQFLLEDLPRAMVGVDDVVADLELDVHDLDIDLEVVVHDLLFGATGNDGPPWLGRPSGRWSTAFPAVPYEWARSSLQVPIDEIDLLQPAKALSDVLRANLSDALDGLELCVRRGEQLVEAPELLDDLGDDELREPGHAPQDPEAARRDRVVEGVQLAVVAHQLGEAAEVEQVLMGHAPELVERGGEALVGVRRQVVVDEGGLVGGDADHDLLELHLDEPALGAELDDVALDLDGHARHELGALEDREHVVQRGAALELQRGQAGGDLVEPRAVLVEGRQRLVGLGQHDGDVLEDVLRAVDVEADDLAPLRDGDDDRIGLLRDALGGAVAGARLQRQDRRVRRELDVGHRDLGRVGVQDDAAVHLRPLVEQGRRVVDVELDASGEQEAELVMVADHQEPARVGVEDVVQALAERGAGRDHLQRLDEPGLLTALELVELIPGSLRHRDDSTRGSLDRPYRCVWVCRILDGRPVRGVARLARGVLEVAAAAEVAAPEVAAATEVAAPSEVPAAEVSATAAV